MSNIDAIILGIIQGLTEFLPVSSSGHLELGKVFLGYEGSDGLFFDVVVHFGTALSTIVVFRKDIIAILAGIFKFKKNDLQFALKIILSMVPAIFVGLVFKDEIERLFNGDTLLVGCALLATGLLLFLADKAKKSEKDVSFLASLLIGISQAIAIFPGVSRSGATISTSVLLGIDKSKAARFSFLMAIPIIVGKVSKDIMDGALNESVHLTPILLGFIFSFFTGLVACKWMISIVRKGKLVHFSLYCFVVGAGAILYTFLK